MSGRDSTRSWRSSPWVSFIPPGPYGWAADLVVRGFPGSSRSPALLLAPVFLSGVPLDPRYSDGRIDLVGYFTGHGIPLIGLTTMMLLGASVARMLLPARSRATGVLAVVGSGLIGALGPVLFIFPIVGFAA